ncbi:hypothetical protein THAOC_23587, partial [Thalassiosira oceanica]
MGDKDSVESINRAFMAGLATKEHYAEALKGYQDAVEEMKNSPPISLLLRLPLADLVPVRGQELVELANSVLLGSILRPDELDLGHLLVRLELGLPAAVRVRHL